MLSLLLNYNFSKVTSISLREVNYKVAYNIESLTYLKLKLHLLETLLFAARYLFYHLSNKVTRLP